QPNSTLPPTRANNGRSAAHDALVAVQGDSPVHTPARRKPVRKARRATLAVAHLARFAKGTCCAGQPEWGPQGGAVGSAAHIPWREPVLNHARPGARNGPA